MLDLMHIIINQLTLAKMKKIKYGSKRVDQLRSQNRGRTELAVES